MKKFICENCKEKSSFTNKELISKFRIRCPYCGSLSLEPVSNKHSLHHDARQAQKERLFSLQGKRRTKYG